MTDIEMLEARIIIAGFFKKRRVELNITEEEVAEKMDMSIATIKNFEAGRYCPSWKHYMQLCEVLKIAPAGMPYEADTELIEEIGKNFTTE